MLQLLTEALYQVAFGFGWGAGGGGVLTDGAPEPGIAGISCFFRIIVIFVFVAYIGHVIDGRLRNTIIISQNRGF